MSHTDTFDFYMSRLLHIYKLNLSSQVNQTNIPYLVMFKRKLWFNVSPGKDLVADLTFHFPQVFDQTLSSFC